MDGEVSTRKSTGIQYRYTVPVLYTFSQLLTGTGKKTLL